MSERRLHAVGLFAVAVLLLPLAVRADENNGNNEDNPPIVVPVLHACVPDSTPQVCDPTFKFAFVSENDEAQITFNVSPGHCSSIKVELIVNGASQGESPFLRWPGEPNLPASFTWSVRLSEEGPSANVLELRATGRVGGCNNGSLGLWGGTLVISENSQNDDGEHN